MAPRTQKNLERFSTFAVTIPSTVQQRSEIPEALMNYPVIKNIIKQSTINISQSFPNNLAKNEILTLAK
jgi:hypothetical protein